MKNRLSKMLLLATCTLSILLISISQQTQANNGVQKFRVFHNGHYLCLPEPAVKAHLREHKNDVLMGSCHEEIPQGD